MRVSPPISALVAALAIALFGSACSGSDASESDKPARTTTTTTKAATVLLTGGEALVASAGPDVPIDEAAKQAVLGQSQRYVDTAVLAPLVDGAVGAEYAGLFDAAVNANATGADKAALTEEGTAPVTTSPNVTATPVRFDGLADRNGALLLVATTFDLDVAGDTEAGPIQIHRTNQLTFAPQPNGTWAITAYRVGVTHSTPDATTSTTVEAQS
ncbi:MAG: hypothetical protein ACRDV7_13290 [Acidimicrobiia bacterium]